MAVEVAGELGGGEVSVLGSRSHPLLRIRDKIRMRAITKLFVFILFTTGSIVARR